MSKIYWHEISKENKDKIIVSKLSINDFVNKYKQPDWCIYPDALKGLLGCWGLIDGSITCIENCKNCDCLKTDSKQD